MYLLKLSKTHISFVIACTHLIINRYGENKDELSLIIVQTSTPEQVKSILLLAILKVMGRYACNANGIII